MIDAEDALDTVPDRRHFYETMQRNNYLLPSIKSSMASLSYMQAVREELVWCPRYN